MFEDYQFEWDPQEAETNLKKHGLSFERARTIWDDEKRIYYHLCDQPETRWLVIARLGPRVYMSAVMTYREDRIRLISARPASKREIERYHHD